jgi:hypothetical protein
LSVVVALVELEGMLLLGGVDGAVLFIGWLESAVAGAGAGAGVVSEVDCA